tara:strand:+ start:485 stop:1822 length:1338 start_codon:yes stop_codon:yes gene_type:complete
MEFVNSNNNLYFRKLQKNENKFFIHGYTNLDDVAIFESLCYNKFPENIKGQFAFVFLSNDKWIACVDHFCTTNLFYTNEIISPIFSDCVKSISCSINQSTLEQLKITRSYSVGEGTIYNEISQVQPEHYVINYTQIQYLNILNSPIQKLNVDHLYNLFVNVASKIDTLTGPPVLCFSGGKDSSFISMLLRHLNYDHKLIHITSKNKSHVIDKNICNKYKDEYNWKIEDIEVEFAKNNNKELFWEEDTFGPKKEALKNYNTSIGLTGEPGVGSNRRTPLLYYAINKPTATLDHSEIINMSLFYCYVLEKRYYPSIGTSSVWGKIKDTNGYKILIDFFNKRINSIDKSNLDRYLIFNIVEKARHRLSAYSQDKSNSWFHIFADYDIQQSSINTPLNEYRKYGIDKYPIYEVGKSKFDNWIDISWSVPCVGLGIPVYKNKKYFLDQFK